MMEQRQERGVPRFAGPRWLPITTGIVLLAMLVLLAACQSDEPESSYVKVFKYDGSIQCENAGIALNEMAVELAGAGIDVVCAQKGHDGLMYPAPCGHPTGVINVYTIHAVNVEEAQALGFALVDTLPEYRDEKCE